MKKLNINQTIATFAGLALLAYLLFASPIMNLFNPSAKDSMSQTPESANQTKVAGFISEEVVVGTGALAESGDTLTVHYVGTLEDGKVFDSSLDRNTPFVFTLGVRQVIRGWDEGLAGMRVGGKRHLVIPPQYAYGEQGVGIIPPNSKLIFDVELIDVQKPSSR